MVKVIDYHLGSLGSNLWTFSSISIIMMISIYLVCFHYNLNFIKLKFSLWFKCTFSFDNLNECFSDVAISSSVREWLRSPSFDARQWEDEELLLMLQTMFIELDLPQKFNISMATLRNFLYEVYNNYNEVPFHNFRHCFCVAQMVSWPWNSSNSFASPDNLSRQMLSVDCPFNVAPIPNADCPAVVKYMTNAIAELPKPKTLSHNNTLPNWNVGLYWARWIRVSH